jgi:hypothetical protein
MIFFAWVGGAPSAPVSVSTKGDVWGGSWKSPCDTWAGSLVATVDILPTSATWQQYTTEVHNLSDISGLVAGRSYYIRGPGIPGATGPVTQTGPGTTYISSVPGTVAKYSDYQTTFDYDGNYGGTLGFPCEPQEAVSVTIYSKSDSSGNADYTNVINIKNPAGLTTDKTYKVSGPGIPVGVTGTFDGTNFMTISSPAEKTAMNAELEFTLDEGLDVIENIADTSELVVGQTYQVFGKGIPNAALGTYQSDGTLLLSRPANYSEKQTFIYIFLGAVYPDGGPFSSSYARNDEDVVSVEIDHSEGNFPLLTIEVKNPRVGLLSPYRDAWCWLSWQDDLNGGPVVPLFHGRLVAVPTNLQNEKVTLRFIAQPSNYTDLQYALAASLQSDPYYDPIWLQDGVSTPDNILEARPSAWHIDRTTLDVTISDITTGEDGTLVIEETDHSYNETDVRFGSKPLSGVYLTASVTHNQQANGTVDITSAIGKAFATAGSGFGSGNSTIVVVNGNGLYSSWPKAYTNIGGGWTVGRDSYIQDMTSIYGAPNLTIKYVIGSNSPNISNLGVLQYPLTTLHFKMTAEYDVSRKWQEIASFFLQSDIQQIVTDSRSSVLSLSLNSNILDWPIDPDGAMPLSDYRTGCYFKTARGAQSIRFLISYAKARLVRSARAVEIDFMTTWAKGVGLTCRWNVELHDGRLPGGQATGKVVAYKLIANARDGLIAKVRIGCTIGHGGSEAAVAGTGLYAAPGYMADGYQATAGGTIDIGDGSVTYGDISALPVGDDGINFFDLRQSDVVQRVTVDGAYTQQISVINAIPTIAQSTLSGPPIPDPAQTLKTVYPRVTLQLVPLDGYSFLTEFAISTSQLRIPKTIDLEAS